MSCPVEALRLQAPESLLQHYEDLRRQSLEGGLSQERDVFARQGMIAWMRAWCHCAPSTLAWPLATPRGRAEKRWVPIPAALQAEVTRVLASIALEVFQEVS